MSCQGSGLLWAKPQEKGRHPKTSQLEKEKEHAKCVKVSMCRQSEDYLGLICNSTKTQRLCGRMPASPKAAPILWLMAQEAVLVCNRCQDCFTVLSTHHRRSLIQREEPSSFLSFLLPTFSHLKGTELNISQVESDSTSHPSPLQEVEKIQWC